MPNSFPILVQPPTVARSTAKVLKTFQTTSYTTGDDGATQRGRLVDFWTLDEANPFGSLKRFTGITGGYQNEATTVYYDVNNSVTNEAGAFPEGIIIDWAVFDGSTVLGWGKSGYTGSGSFFTLVAYCAGYGTTTYPTGWSAPNINEYWTLRDFGANDFLSVLPFGITTVLRVISGTADMYNSANCEYIQNISKRLVIAAMTYNSQSNCIIPVRVFSVNGTTLT